MPSLKSLSKLSKSQLMDLLISKTSNADVSEECEGIVINTNYENQTGGHHSIAVYGKGIRDKEIAMYLDGHGARKPYGDLTINGEKTSGLIFPKKVSTFKSLMFLFKNLKKSVVVIGGEVKVDGCKKVPKKSHIVPRKNVESEEDEDEEAEGDDEKPMVVHPKKRRQKKGDEEEEEHDVHPKKRRRVVSVSDMEETDTE